MVRFEGLPLPPHRECGGVYREEQPFFTSEAGRVVCVREREISYERADSRPLAMVILRVCVSYCV